MKLRVYPSVIGEGYVFVEIIKLGEYGLNMTFHLNLKDKEAYSYLNKSHIVKYSFNISGIVDMLILLAVKLIINGKSLNLYEWTNNYEEVEVEDMEFKLT